MTVVHDHSVQGHDGETLAPALRAAHDIWLRDTDGFLLPVIRREASFWSRWTTIRFLADQFAGPYRRERALLEELRPFLSHDVAERLTREGEGIRRLQCELDRVGRRRGSAHAVSVMSRRFLELLRSWCAEIEAATAGIRRDMLTPEGHQLLLDIERYTNIHS